MKNLTKIFMAVAVAMIAFACATDLTDDLGVQLGGGEGQTTITVSLEESRTQLGEKDADGLYPIYWSEGDAISVNGVASVAQISEENPAYATFAVAEADKYELAYPAANAGQVLFAEKQNHVAAGNTFESGVATMYGTGTIENGFTLRHLTGVLKFAVVGDAVLSKIQVSTIDRAPIAGAFNIDFKNGKLTATEASKNVIEYSFGEAGLQLTADAQWMHVAVPAGKYDELYVTLYEQGNSGNIMYATVKANDDPNTEKVEKPLTAGSVREFNTPITYSPNAQLFVIDSPERLTEFKIKIESEAGLTMDAILTEDIDMTGYSWISIVGNKYTNTIYGNGYAIKGLTAPLFNTTVASFKGLHLEDVNINSNGVRVIGALACILAQTTAEGAKVENCSVSGTITIENPELADGENVICGGLVATAHGVKFDGCVNNANIVVKQLTAGNVGGKLMLGGLCAKVEGHHAEGVESVYTTFVNSKNYGDIDMSECVEGTTITDAYIGGIGGFNDNTEGRDNFGLVIDNCENHGDITAYRTFANLHAGGFLAYNSHDTEVVATISNAVNHGKVTLKSGSTISTAVYLGGFAGLYRRSAILNAVNEQNATIKIEAGAITQALQLGGIVGNHQNSGTGAEIRSCENKGAVVYEGNSVEAAGSTFRLGGISGYSQGSIIDCINRGNITIGGNLNLHQVAPSDFKAGYHTVGGIVGYKTESRIYSVENYGTITLSGNMTSVAVSKEKVVASQMNVGGIAGYSAQYLLTSEKNTTSVSKGKIVVSGNTTLCNLCIGGLIGHVYNNPAEPIQESEADIEISGTHTGALYVGGVLSAIAKKSDKLVYNGSITITENANISGKSYIGGCVAYIKEGNLTNCTNNGAITFEGTATDGIYIGGVVITVGGDATNLTNNGNLSITGNVSTYVIGGVSGGTITGAASGCGNLGNITFSGTSIGSGNLCGLIFKSTGAMENCYNGEKGSKTKGVINGGGTTKGALNVGGIIYSSTGNLTNVVNYAPINVTGNYGSSLYIGGIARQGVVNNCTWTECINYGDTTVSGAVGDINIDGSSGGSDTFFGGIFSSSAGAPTEMGSPATLIRCQNHGDFIFTETFNNAGAVRGAGIVGRWEHAHPLCLEDCWNSGDITFNGATATRDGGNFKVTGIISYLSASKQTFTVKGAIINSGDITINGNCTRSSNITLGGVIGENSTCHTTLVEGETECLIANTGDISYNAGDNQYSFLMGGVIAWYNCSGKFDAGIKLVNTGDISATGTFATATVNSAGEPTTYSCYIGGIGFAKKTIPYAESYCTINALGLNAGILMGIPYTAGAYEITAGKVGGTIYCDSIEDPNSGVGTNGPGELTSDNWFQYIYGGALEAAPTGIEYITEAPVVALPAELPAATTPEVTE